MANDINFIRDYAYLLCSTIVLVFAARLLYSNKYKSHVYDYTNPGNTHTVFKSKYALNLKSIELRPVSCSAAIARVYVEVFLGDYAKLRYAHRFPNTSRLTVNLSDDLMLTDITDRVSKITIRSNCEHLRITVLEKVN